MTQQALTFSAILSDTLAYLLHVPPRDPQDSAKRWPLILFLHGAGERGYDVEQIKKHGIPKIVESREDFPFVTVSPQCPPNTWWSEHAATLIALLDNTLATQPVDPERVYLTGLSMGGFGTWHLAVTYPGRFAAIAPICGGGFPFHGFPQRASELSKTPVWAFHGAKDDVVPLSASQELVEVLRQAGGEVRFTVYPEAAHDAWTQTYDNPELYEWFLQHTL